MLLALHVSAGLLLCGVTEALFIVPSPVAPVACNVRDHGARGDNVTEDTAALSAALAACTASGDATVVPPGTYLIRPVRLPSGANLVVQPGATLTAWPDRYTWPNSTEKPCDFDHEGSSCCLKSLPCCVPQKESLLWATNASNITISGGGVIDGNAPNNEWHRGPGNASADGKHFAPFYNNFWHMCRPRMVELRWVKNPKIENVTIQNSIMFNVHAAHVTNLQITNVTIHSLGPNTDGFNVAGANMHIKDSTVCNNDDCIPVNAPTNGLLVERVNCICQWGGGFVPMIGDKDTSWGADCSFIPGTNATTCAPRGDIQNVVFRDSLFNHTSTAIIMKSTPVSEGTIRNVTYENLRLHGVRTGICINVATQGCTSRGYEFDERLPARLTTAHISSSAGVMNVEGVAVRNVSGDGVVLAGYLNCPQDLKGVEAQGNCTGLALEHIRFPGAMPYFCDGELAGETSDCSPSVCHLNASSTA